MPIKVASTKWIAICWSWKLREAAGLAATMLTLLLACLITPAAVTDPRLPKELSNGIELLVVLVSNGCLCRGASALPSVPAYDICSMYYACGKI